MDIDLNFEWRGADGNEWSSYLDNDFADVASWYRSSVANLDGEDASQFLYSDYMTPLIAESTRNELGHNDVLTAHRPQLYELPPVRTSASANPAPNNPDATSVSICCPSENICLNRFSAKSSV
jgi:hypothetical protein